MLGTDVNKRNEEQKALREKGPSKELSRSAAAKKLSHDIIKEAIGDDDPIEVNTPKAAPLGASYAKPRSVGYVSKFVSFLSPDDKALIETAEYMYKNRADWNLDSSGESSLYYTSKTAKRIEEERKQVMEKNKNANKEENNHLMTLKTPIFILLIAAVFLFSFVLPNFLNLILAFGLVGASGYMLFLEKIKLEEDEENTEKPFKTYKIKAVTNVMALPDDIANALTDNERRKQWDIFHSTLKESPQKVVFHRKSQTCCQILEQRLSSSKNMREVFIELSKIKGKPYFLRLSYYSSVSEEMVRAVGEENVKTNVSALRNYVITEDSISEMNISLSNIRSDAQGMQCNPYINMTDLIGEIEEIDMGEDAITEQDIEDSIYIDTEEQKVTGSNKDSPQKITNLIEEEIKIEEEKQEPSKDLTFEEKFELDLKKCPPNEIPIIKKAKENVDKLLKLADHPNWKHITSKGNDCYSMDAEGGLKCIKGEGMINYSPQEVYEYLSREGVQKDYDDQFAEGGTIEELSMKVKYLFSRFKGVFMVSGRDFCFLGITVHFPDGRIIIAVSSAEHKDCPPVKKYVRAELIIGGWILTPDSDDENKTFAQYISQSDLKGNIPKKIVNSVSEKQGLLVHKVNDAMKKYTG
jgi:hypothetical protein